ncbi:MAG TPA: hypothetical protein VGF48_25070 [Thermoanaerobaculia bacterium]|jgi:hypothetical protein
MRALFASFAVVLLALPLLAQSRTTQRRLPARADTAEAVIKQAGELLVDEKKIYDRDVQVLRHLQAADEALTDDMQRAVGLQTAFEEVAKARSLGADYTVVPGLIKMGNELETARRSISTADFGRLRSLLREHALGPASRVAMRNALKLEEEMLAWLKVQELISVHLRQMSEISGQSLRASQE